MRFEEKLAAYTQMTNVTLERYLPPAGGLAGAVCEAMAYSVRAGGKRIRPALVLGFCEACGGNTAAALPLACAVEFVHTYSLIHDDLPCMDDDDLRRGQPSCHIRFGEATALLAGDALLSLAFETALCNNENGLLSAGAAAAAACELARASGSAGMVGGQMIDLRFTGQKAPLAAVDEMHLKKTGAMIVAAARMGCIAAGAGKELLAAADAYAGYIGLAFQIVDDILDATTQTASLGKPAGSDADKSKSTYVALLGLDKSRERVEELTRAAKESIDVFGGREEFLAPLADYLAGRAR